MSPFSKANRLHTLRRCVQGIFPEIVWTPMPRLRSSGMRQRIVSVNCEKTRAFALGSFRSISCSCWTRAFVFDSNTSSVSDSSPSPHFTPVSLFPSISIAKGPSRGMYLPYGKKKKTYILGFQRRRENDPRVHTQAQGLLRKKEVFCFQWHSTHGARAAGFNSVDDTIDTFRTEGVATGSLQRLLPGKVKSIKKKLKNTIL